MKKLLLLLFSITLSFNSFGEKIELDFLSGTFCDNSPKAQVRNGLFYLPNQEEPFSGENLCVYLSNGQYFSQGEVNNGLKVSKWTYWKENGQIEKIEYYIVGNLVSKFSYYENTRKDQKVAEQEALKAKAKKIMAEVQRKAEEAKTKEAEILVSKAIEIIADTKIKTKIEKAKVKRIAEEAKTKEAESKRLVEEDQQNKVILELEIAALKLAKEEIWYNRLLTQEVQEEQDAAKSIILEDLLSKLKTAYVMNIAARIKTFWRYQGAEDDWTCEVYVIQDRQGQVNAVDVRNCNGGNSSLAKSFRESIERAVYKASPLPAAPDESVFDSEIYMLFSVN